jgi:uncharacterized protein YuzB (UPF0349 family)
MEASRQGDLDRLAPTLIQSLASYEQSIANFQISGGTPGLSVGAMGERLMQVATATHKAKGTLRYIARSAAQYVAALHADHLLTKGLAKQVSLKSLGTSGVPASLRSDVNIDKVEYVCVEVTAASQWDTISYEIVLGGTPAGVLNPNVAGGGPCNVSV